MLSNLKIGKRLGIAFAAVLLLMAALGTTSALKMQQIQAVANDISGNWLFATRELGQMKADVIRYRMREYGILLERESGGRAEVEKVLAETAQSFEKAAKAYESTITLPEERKLNEAIMSKWTAYRATSARLLAFARNGQLKEAEALMAGDLRKLYSELETTMDEDIAFNARGADAAVTHSDQVYSTALITVLVLGGLAIALGIFAAWSIARSITLPLNAAVGAADAIAAGDLSKDVTVRSRDEVGQLLAAMKQMQQVLSGMIGQTKAVVGAAAHGDFSRRVDGAGLQGFQMELANNVNTLVGTTEEGLKDLSRVLGALAQGDLTKKIERNYDGLFGELKEAANKTTSQLAEIVTGIKESADTINVASREIASGNADLSQRTEEQASSLEETASSMEELTSTVKQNAENARQANQLAIGASAVAVKGGQVVKDVVSTMTSINESSRKVVDIISVIDGIAFQTNILALNAAVEAARAGEQGRGFAVVATEVRNLAQRSAAAAKEIKTLIGDSVGKVDIGSRLVDEAGKTMEEIVVSVKRVTDIMAEITAASQEQSSGIEQVSTAVGQMDEVTQQNAALVEEAAAAAESLEEQATTLATAIATFKTSATGVTSQPRPAAHREAAHKEPVGNSPKAGKPAADTARRQPKKPMKKLAVAGGAADSSWEEF